MELLHHVGNVGTNKDDFAGNGNVITLSITRRLRTLYEHQNYGFQHTLLCDVIIRSKICYNVESD